jgi:hypothetical protein
MSKRKERFFNADEVRPSTRSTRMRVTVDDEAGSGAEEQPVPEAAARLLPSARAHVRLELGREAIFVSGVDDEHICRHRLRAAGGRWGLCDKWIFNRSNSEPLLALLDPPMTELPAEDTNTEIICEHEGSAEDGVTVKCSNGKSIASGYCRSDSLKCFRCKGVIIQGSLVMGLNISKSVTRWFDDDHGYSKKVATTQYVFSRLSCSLGFPVTNSTLALQSALAPHPSPLTPIVSYHIDGTISIALRA